ncbi:Translational regulator CsrA [Planctomycetales bacterium 10988]|nr:Translational regulator CsrA [Planctomycetales bacterium 10988]
MLVLSRREGERIQIGDGISLTVVSVSNGKVRLGIEAPQEVKIVREELIGIPPRATNPGNPSLSSSYSSAILSNSK